jgi:GT2 family glycosyltransferase
VNRGIREATRDTLVLLNNDTIPIDGWLSALLRTLRDHPDVGVVGGRLVYPDGRLQEAGGVIFSDGSAANFGNGDGDPDAPEYSFLRDVDYVSAALLATPRSLMSDIGGIDPIWGFGYYDDADYAFKVRARGLRTVYQPESVIIHIEGGSAGRDVERGAKRAQVVNQRTFRDRWRQELAHQPDPPGETPPELRAVPVRPAA